MASARNSESGAEETRDGFRFRGGHVALDFTATLAGRLRDEQNDLFVRPGDIARWLNAAGFVCAGARPDASTLDAARRLREAIYGLATARVSNLTPPPAVRKTLNDAARTPAASPEIDGRGHTRIRGDADALLSLVAREAIVLLGGERGGHVRQCEADGCAILFLDTSRSADRRWCSMAACGNRHKVAQFRQRKRKH